MPTHLRCFRWAARAAGGLVALALLAAPAAAQSLTDPTLSVSTLTGGLADPTAMAFLGPGDFLVTEKAGTVRRVLNGVLQPTPVLTVLTNDSGETGLLGIAVNTETPRKVFLYYSAAASQGGIPSANRVVRYTWNSSSGLLESPLTVLDLPFGLTSHHGGALLMGPPNQAPGVGDGGLLYAVIGDLERNGQLQNNPSGSSPDDSGVIFRVRQDGTAAPNNPFTPYCRGQTTQTCSNDGNCGGNAPCATAVAKYFAYGVRNSFGLALDPVNGGLWASENGPDNFDELNRVASGFNSGWNAIMGPNAEDPQGTADLFNMPGAGSTYSDPELSWQLTSSPTGIVIPVGSSLGASYDNKLLVGAFNNATLYAIPLNASRNGFDFSSFPDLSDLVADNDVEKDLLRLGSGFGGSFNGIVDLELGPDLAVYVVSIGGSIYRITGPGPGQGPGPVVTPRPPQPDLRDLGRDLGEAASDALGSPP
jgi:glucose/arabinose dehydrogenase